LKVLQNEDIDSYELIKIYSKQYFNILVINNLTDIIQDYYLCSNNRYLAEDGKYVTKLHDNNIVPRNYLKTFIYPIMLSTKI